MTNVAFNVQLIKQLPIPSSNVVLVKEERRNSSCPKWMKVKVNIKYYRNTRKSF